MKHTSTIELGQDSITVEVDTKNLGGGGVVINVEGFDPTSSDPFSVAVGAIASLVLAHASAGIDVAGQQYAQAVRDVLEGIANEHA